MLVLTRRLDETVLIGDEIEVQVVSISRGKVQLGITAPRDVTVLREEVAERVEEEEPVYDGPVPARWEGSE